MSTDSIALALQAAPAPFRFVFSRMAANWGSGGLTVSLPDGHSFSVGEPGAEAKLIVHDYRFLGRCITRGDVGFAEGYMAGEWDTPDLANLLEVMAINWERIRNVAEGGIWTRVLGMVVHTLNRNSRKGARRNIEAHYDLGNDFYAQWLDPGMTYSSALFARPDQSLQDAQTNKYAALARSIDLKPGHEVLEIGCGWGGFAEYAAKEVGAKVVGLTLSPAQRDYAQKRLFEQGLAEKVDIRLTDYRDVEGRFDRVASIEMFEAVGLAYWPAYFGKLAEVLKPGGKAGLQVITIEQRLFDRYCTRSDFIQTHIFPGGMLPSETRFAEAVEAAGLRLGETKRFGSDYGRTLIEWLERFDAAWPHIRAQGFDESFRRLWRFYLSYCAAGFRTGRTDVMQAVLTRS